MTRLRELPDCLESRHLTSEEISEKEPEAGAGLPSGLQLPAPHTEGRAQAFLREPAASLFCVY